MLEQLKSLSMFKKVDNNLIQQLIQNRELKKVSYNKGETVNEQETECLGVYVVLSGKLIAYSLSLNGSETIVFEFKKDYVIGANLLFGDVNKYPMNIYCTSSCELLYISKQAISKLLANYQFVMWFIRSLSLNSQYMNKRIAMNTQKTLQANIKNYLLILSSKQRSKKVILPTSKKQLADYFGVQRPSLFRVLKLMKEENLIDINNREITINFSD